MTAFLEEENDHRPLTEISQEEVQMAITLTEYFQAQRQAYNKVYLYCNYSPQLKPHMHIDCISIHSTVWLSNLLCLWSIIS